MKYGLAFLCIYWAGCTAAADRVSPTRYVDAQGVEVIRDRLVEPATASGIVVGSTFAQLTNRSNGLANDPRLRVGAVEQAQRDRGRIDILQHELEVEGARLAAIIKRAQLSEGEKRTAAESQRITEEMHERQQNIHALNAELRRARITQ